MRYVTIIAIAVILIYLVNKLLQLPKVYKVSQEQLKKYFEILLYRGYDGGFAIIGGSKPKVFLQLKNILLIM